MKPDLATLEKKAALLRALAHPIRLCILIGLSSGPCNVKKMQECFGVRQSTVSQHLFILKSAGLIRPVRRGVEIFYEISNPEVPAVLEALIGKPEIESLKAKMGR